MERIGSEGVGDVGRRRLGAVENDESGRRCGDGLQC